MTFAALIIFGIEMTSVVLIMGRYTKEGSFEEFLSKTSPEDLYRVHVHGSMGMLMLMLASILSIVGIMK